MSKETGFYRKVDGAIEFVTIKLFDTDDEEFDMDTLKTIFKDTLEEQKEKLEKMVDLGTAILGDRHKGVYFMFGWVIQKIIGTYEAKNNTKLRINVDVESMDNDEIKDKTVEALEDILEKIKNDDIDLSDMPMNMGGIDYE